MSNRAEDGSNLLPLIGKVNGLVAKAVAKRLFREYGLTYPQYQFLLAARDAADPTLGSLAGLVNCAPGNLTGISDRLERDGWVKRERRRSDRREVRIILTKKGNRVTDIEAGVRQAVADLTGAWPEAERLRIQRALVQMEHSLKGKSAESTSA
jgi:DNA-binding MarR family transcriptional regulator